MIMSRFHSSSLLLMSAGLLLAGPYTAKADFFDFEANAPNTAAPFTDTVSGLSATFGGSASVCNSFGLFQSLSGHVLIQGFCGPATQSGPMSLSFSSNLTRVAFNFATVGGPGIITLAAFEGMTAAGGANFTSAAPSGFLNGEGLASFSGTFDRLTITSSELLALDNVNAQTNVAPAPEPSLFALVFVGLGALMIVVCKRRLAGFCCENYAVRL